MHEKDEGDSAAELATKIRKLRAEAKLSHAQLAADIGYSRQYVSRAEQPGRGLPSPNLVEALDRALSAGGVLRELRDSAGRQHRARRVHAYGGDAARGGPVPSHGDPRSDPSADSDLYLEALATRLAPDEAISMMGSLINSAIRRYDIEGPELLWTEVEAARKICMSFPLASLASDVRSGLLNSSAKLSGLLSYMAVNRAAFGVAERYAIEATFLATACQDSELLAWIKGTQSFAAYYQDRFSDALKYARAGLKFADSAPGQRVRLLSNGVARAAAKLGEHTTALRAAEEAQSIAAHDDRIGPCIDLGPYTRSRTTSNVVTALLAMGRYSDAIRLGTDLLDSIPETDDWSRSLIKFDLATAMASAGDGSPQEASSLGVEALKTSASKPITSVVKRSAELAEVLRPLPETSSYIGELADWCARIENVTA